MIDPTTTDLADLERRIARLSDQTDALGKKVARLERVNNALLTHLIQALNFTQRIHMNETIAQSDPHARWQIAETIKALETLKPRDRH